MEKYLFLDIDGVLNSKESFSFYSKLKKKKITKDFFYQNIKIMPIDEKYGKLDILSSDHVFIPHLNLLKDFIDENNIKVVGISSWFITYDIESISDFMGINFIGKSIHCGGSGSQRTEGINEYFKSINKKIEEVDYVIFDDAPNGYKTKNYIQVMKKIDLELLDKARKVLNL